MDVNYRLLSARRLRDRIPLVDLTENFNIPCYKIDLYLIVYQHLFETDVNKDLFLSVKETFMLRIMDDMNFN